MIKSILTFTFCFAVSGLIVAQIPAQLTISLKRNAELKSGDEVTLEVNVRPNEGTFVYSALPSDEFAYKPFEIIYDSSSIGFTTKSKIEEQGTIVKKYDNIMEGELRYYETSVVFSQKLTINASKFAISGVVSYMAGNELTNLIFEKKFEIK